MTDEKALALDLLAETDAAARSLYAEALRFDPTALAALAPDEIEVLLRQRVLRLDAALRDVLTPLTRLTELARAEPDFHLASELVLVE